MKTLIMCIGNRFGGDDSVGPYIANNLRKIQNIHVIDCGIIPENYTSIKMLPGSHPRISCRFPQRSIRICGTS